MFTIYVPINIKGMVSSIFVPLKGMVFTMKGMVFSISILMKGMIFTSYDPVTVKGTFSAFVPTQDMIFTIFVPIKGMVFFICVPIKGLVFNICPHKG